MSPLPSFARPSPCWLARCHVLPAVRRPGGCPRESAFSGVRSYPALCSSIFGQTDRYNLSVAVHQPEIVLWQISRYQNTEVVQAKCSKVNIAAYHLHREVPALRRTVDLGTVPGLQRSDQVIPIGKCLLHGGAVVKSAPLGYFLDKPLPFLNVLDWSPFACQHNQVGMSCAEASGNLLNCELDCLGRNAWKSFVHAFFLPRVFGFSSLWSAFSADGAVSDSAMYRLSRSSSVYFNSRFASSSGSGGRGSALFVRAGFSLDTSSPSAAFFGRPRFGFSPDDSVGSWRKESVGRSMLQQGQPHFPTSARCALVPGCGRLPQSSLPAPQVRVA